MRQEANREPKGRYCQAKWPFFGAAIGGQRLLFHHHPRNPDWHAPVACQTIVPVDRSVAPVRVAKERIRAFLGAA